jgi:hypothetical protein
MENKMRLHSVFGVIFSLLVLVIFPSSLYSQRGDAGMPGSYLHMGVGARALGMGKAYTALATDPTAIYWNPAGLATQDPYQIYVMHSMLYFDTHFDYVGASAPTHQFGSFGLGLLSLSSGGFDQRSVLNEELGTFSMLDLAFLFNWSKEVYPGLSVGLNYKLVTQRMLEFSGVGHGLDVGLKTRLFKGLDVGLTVMNVLRPQVKLAHETQSYPSQFRLGVASSFFEDKLTFSADLAKIIGWESTRINVGCEYRVLKQIAIHAGVHQGRFTVGSGFSFNHYGFDYSHSSVSELGMNHRFAVRYAFSGFGVKADAYPEIFSPKGEQNISKIKLQVKSRTEVSSWQLEILDMAGNVVRDFSERGPIPEQIVWDGRNNKGSLVADGRFCYRFVVQTESGKSLEGNGSLVSIDSKGPMGTLGLKQER